MKRKRVKRNKQTEWGMKQEEETHAFTSRALQSYIQVDVIIIFLLHVDYTMAVPVIQIQH